MLLDDLVEIARIEQARSRGGRRRWRIGDDDVVGLVGTVEETAAIIDDNLRQRRTADLVGVVMVVAEHRGYARDQIDSRGGNAPGEHGAKAGAHAEADHETVFRRMGQRSEGQVSDVLRDRVQERHSRTVDEKLSIKTFSRSNDGSGVV